MRLAGETERSEKDGTPSCLEEARAGARGASLPPNRLVMPVSGTEFLESIRKDSAQTTPLP
jgi:hypothetical protein